MSTVHITERDGLTIGKISPTFGPADKEGVMFLLVSGIESKKDKESGIWIAKNKEKLGKQRQSRVIIQLLRLLFYLASITLLESHFISKLKHLLNMPIALHYKNQ